MKHESTDGLLILGFLAFLVIFVTLFFLQLDTDELKAWKKHVEMCGKYNGFDLSETPKYCWPEGARTE